MKIVLLILLSICATLRAEPPRIKIRTPPFYRRMPPLTQQFSAKKWYQPPRPQPVRTRPIPVHMPPTHKIPMGMPQAPPRAIAPPIRTFWKNTQQPPMKFAFPEKVFHKMPMHVPEQMFMKAPTTNFLDQEYDHSIQTNIIPAAHIKSIKQVGEIGPIHTIPAPNLSLKDKPIIVNDARKDYSYQHSSPYLKAEKLHHYQVTEHPEPTNSVNEQELQRQFQQQQLRQQQMHQQKIQFQIQQQVQQQQHQQQQQQQQQQMHIQQQIEQHLQQKGHILDDIQIQPQQLYYEASTPVQTIQQPPHQTGEIFLGNNMNAKDLYQIIETTYPQSTDSAQQLQQNFQLFQHEQNFDMSTAASDHKSRFQPEYHSFNYNEQDHQASQKNNLAKKELSSLVTAGYNLQGDTGEIVPRNRLEEPEVVHGFFENRSELERNDVEPQQKVEEEKADEEMLGSSHYSSLPNQEAAERLAKLQTAGKINSNLMQLAESNDQAEDIYLVENNDRHAKDNNDDTKDETEEYEEYLQNNASNDEEQNFEFGDRIKSTKI